VSIKAADAARALLVPLGLAVVVLVLVLAGRGDLAAPPLGSWDDLSDWLERTDTVTAVLAIVRLLALVVAVWLLVATLVGAVGRLARRARVVAFADRALPAPIRRALTGLAGASAASVVVLGAAGLGGGDGEEAVPVGEQLVLLPEAGEGTATMSVLPDPAPGAPAAAPTPAQPATWTVEPGDSFWSIAEEVLAETWGRPPTDAEIDPYWRALIAANRDRISSGNPDLVFPGQEFVLPPP
jgi:LysM domain